MKKLIIGFVGEIASGKGEASDYITKKHQTGYFRFSTIIREVLKRLHLEESRETMQRISLVLRENFGQDLFAKVIAKDAENDPHQIVCVDGIRRTPDIKYLRELPNFHLINIQTEEKIRFERIIRRAENPDDKNKTFQEFQKDQQGETELTIREVAKQANFIVNNNGTFEELYSQLDDLITKLNTG
ncbi:AAA family ATPase [Candidatus Falkowbacteria bacterium]|jgi:dephospho-CoA kinase|nr:AAA family ATPase [Candidatus Falkowbacteria bacterium]MBT5503559.1 AAA family ATPase [Candidatus Falkowbacteria bacterium]MBT6573596.1 AAA family ATPase [Candidatus Falkowbacteria bacterium]MBT7348404.1 AAA family ATPase [Candidatus Falkowbacteria bacterium]MBT7500642.1 AAA family ATPase [Candidatus Falkowbacteria bacterium]